LDSIYFGKFEGSIKTPKQEQMKGEEKKEEKGGKRRKKRRPKI